MDSKEKFELEQSKIRKTFRKVKGLSFSAIRKITKSKSFEQFYWKYLHGFYAANAETTLPLVKKSFQKALELNIVENGDYYEFGIFNGYTFLYAQKLAEFYGIKNMRFFGFDSFRGLPEIRGKDKTDYFAFYEGELSYPKEKVIENLDRNGVDWSKTFIIDGFFKNSLNETVRKKYNMGKSAIVLVDCDLYTSTVEVLNFISDMMAENTILIFDEYNSAIFRNDENKGEKKAFKDFLKMNDFITVKEFLSIGTGRAFIIHKKEK